MPSVHYCGFCHSQVPIINGMKRHFAQKAECRKRFQAEIGKSIVTVFNDKIPGSPQPMPNPDPPSSEDESPMEDVDVGEVYNNFIPGQVHSRLPTVEEASSGQQSKRAWVEEVENEDTP